jgi:hypothetical protein
MNKFAKIADGLAGWLTFEQQCGRDLLFSESYFACAVGKLLQYRYPGRVLAEVEHPILSKLKEGPGKKPRVDFAVTGEKKGKFEVVIEAKWVSKSPTLLRDIIRDIIRLDLILPNYSKEAIMILVGNVKEIKKLFQDPTLTYENPLPTTHQQISIEGHNRNAIYFFHNLSAPRRDLYSQVLQVFRDVEISRTIQVERSGPFPRKTTTDHYEVYIWKIMPRGKKFKPEEYDELSLERLSQ